MGKWRSAMEGMVVFHGIYNQTRVLVTGHTGFKGAWLCQWLLNLGAEVSGLALEPNTNPNLFKLLELEKRISNNAFIDIRDRDQVIDFVKKVNPEIVIHMAAQPLVRLSYEDPVTTWETNVMGTVNVLEAVRQCPSVDACVVVTSDKCYENREQVWGYRECDPVGGHDPYSASKGAVELVTSSYRRSYFTENDTCNLASARAGNVIGGGDWAADRIVVDFVKSICDDVSIELRNPHATRPWQHVLEPLSGYLHLAEKLYGDEGSSFAGPWNFGPFEGNAITVESLINQMVDRWGRGEVQTSSTIRDQPHEAGLLKLDCSKSHAMLGWQSVWNVEQTIEVTVKWYKSWLNEDHMLDVTNSQIKSYASDAKKLETVWAES